MMNLQEQKKELRGQIRDRMKKIPPQEAQESSRQIIENVVRLPEYATAHAVFCFVGAGFEIDTVPLLQHLMRSGKRLAVPLCTAPGVMEARIITSLDDLQRVGSFGILEPGEHTPILPKEEIELAIIPCISCDVNGNRLGQGGGYYDRFLNDRGYPAVCICREQLLCPQIPMEPLDQTIDVVVTETRVIRLSGS